MTGGSGAIGRAIGRRLADKPGYEVVLLCRNEAKAKAAVAEIQRVTQSRRVRFHLVDLSRRHSIQALAANWQGPVDILVNNAAVTPRQRLETPEGIELQFATNVLGYFWLTAFFSPFLARSAQGRVINVASYWAGGLDLDDLEFRRRRYDNDAAYRQSKQANRMLTAAFATRLKAERVTVNACHPGDVNSTLSNNLGFGGHETPDAGARTPEWLATSDAGRMHTGRYFERLHEVPCRFSADVAAVEALYQACASY